MRTGLAVGGVVLFVLGLIGFFIGFGSLDLATQLYDLECTGLFPPAECPQTLVVIISLIVTVVGIFLLILGIVLRGPREETRPA